MLEADSAGTILAPTVWHLPHECGTPSLALSIVKRAHAFEDLDGWYSLVLTCSHPPVLATSGGGSRTMNIIDSGIFRV